MISTTTNGTSATINFGDCISNTSAWWSTYPYTTDTTASYPWLDDYIKNALSDAIKQSSNEYY